MKKITLFSLIMLFSIHIFSQDRIYLKDYSVIEAVVKDVSAYMIKYSKFSDPSGDVLAVAVDDVAKIVYQNGNIREFSKADVRKAQGSGDEKTTYFALGAGFGRSYGGIGVRAQARFGNKQGFGLHAGLGYNPTNAGGLCFGVGAKFYYYRWLYINAQVGIVTHDYYWDYWDYYNPESYFGISILVGGDFYFNNHIGLNAAIGPTIIPDLGVRMGFDLGLIIKF